MPKKLSQKSEFPPTPVPDENTGQRQQGQTGAGLRLVAYQKPAALGKPGQGACSHPPAGQIACLAGVVPRLRPDAPDMGHVVVPGRISVQAQDDGDRRGAVGAARGADRRASGGPRRSGSWGAGPGPGRSGPGRNAPRPGGCSGPRSAGPGDARGSRRSRTPGSLGRCPMRQPPGQPRPNSPPARTRAPD